MSNYEARTFVIPPLEGISERSVQEHLGLYQGYVKNFNAINTVIAELAQAREKNAHAIAELVRRKSFEFDGMRLHELYFSQFEGGAQAVDTESDFAKKVIAAYGSFDTLMQEMKYVALMRGPGWALLYFDPTAQTFHIGFSGEQHQGHFVTLPVICALDVWEHSYLLDHGAQGKSTYVDAFFKSLNWTVCAERFATL